MSGEDAATRPAYAALFLPPLLGLQTLIICMEFWRCSQAGSGCEIAGDFTVFYKAGLEAVSHNLSMLYDTSLKPDMPGIPENALFFHPFLNPPSALLFLYPLGLLSYTGALFVWYGAQVVLMLVFLRTDYARALMGNPIDVFLLLSPFVALTVFSGQTGLLTADFAMLMLAWRARRPYASGLLLACLSFKPLLGLALPVLLLKERNWRALLAAALGVLCLVALSIAMWGKAPWPDYASMLEFYQKLIALAPPHLLMLSANAFMGLCMLGMNNFLAWRIQPILSLGIIFILWEALGRGATEPRKVVLLASATFLISPYSFLYDTVLAAFACAVLLKRWKSGEATPGERLSLALMAFIPVVGIKLQTMGIPYAFLSLLVAFMVMLPMPETDEPKAP